MNKYTVKTDEAHFNWIKEDIQHDINKLAEVFQNPNVVITEDELKVFKLRYLELKGQLEAWNSESLRRIKLQKEND
ncbi:MULTISPECIES: hypothetical protein [unclassified Oceanobacillus]|uniref:hypothetical protein n=1 Tax=unclassified Oceanobacillus TaxID=2630292 RepID=UPI00300DF2D0